MIPPLFAGNSHCLPHRVSDNTQALVTCAATSQPTIASLEIRIWCEARGCIRNKFSVHLSSTGCFLSVPLIFTSSRQSCCSASINAIIDAVRRICQENIFLKTATFYLFHLFLSLFLRTLFPLHFCARSSLLEDEVQNRIDLYLQCLLVC